MKPTISKPGAARKGPGTFAPPTPKVSRQKRGKVLSDAMGSVRRGIDMVEFACGMPAIEAHHLEAASVRSLRRATQTRRIERFKFEAERIGANVHTAEGADDVVRIVLDLARSHGVQKIVN